MSPAASKSCSCSEVSLQCLDATQFYFLNGWNSNTIAFATNKDSKLKAPYKPCTIYMYEAHCAVLGLTSTTSPQPVDSIYPSDCTVYITGTSDFPGDELGKSYLCCIGNHEKVHVKQKECNGDQVKACTEAPAYGTEQTCLADVAAAFTSAYPEEPLGPNICAHALGNAAAANLASCLCKASKDGGTVSIGSNVTEEDIDNCKKDCLDNTSPDDVSPACDDLLSSESSSESTSEEDWYGSGTPPTYDEIKGEACSKDVLIDDFILSSSSEDSSSSDTESSSSSDTESSSSSVAESSSSSDTESSSSSVAESSSSSIASESSSFTSSEVSSLSHSSSSVFPPRS